jgi:diguanylate cyclase (GGDEF)-like protein
VAEPVAVEERARADLLRLLYQQVPLSSLISALVATMLCAILWDLTPRDLLKAWWLAIVALALFRVGLTYAFRRRPDDAALRAWEQRFVVTLVLTGAAWGVGGWLAMPKESLAHQILIYAFLMGMVGGAIASYSAHFVATSATSVLIMLPATLAFAIQESALTRMMAIASVIYLLAAFRAARAISTSLKRSYQLTHELEAARADAERQARTDELTEMRNRRAFYELGELAIAQAARYRDPLAVIMLDIDRFKDINDTWGHAAGDEILRLVALIVQRTVRTSDIAGRVGGEEFAILLPRATPADAVAMAERLRAAMEKAPLWHDQGEIHFTASFGVASAGEGETLDHLLAEADKALYDAKEGGRNRVACRAPAATKAASSR